MLSLTIRLIIDHYVERGATSIMPMDCIARQDGGEVLLVWFRNSNGVEMSGLGGWIVDENGDSDIAEIACVPRADEKDMIEGYMEG